MDDKERARRKRILENAVARLSRITGRPTELAPGTSSNPPCNVVTPEVPKETDHNNYQPNSSKAILEEESSGLGYSSTRLDENISVKLSANENRKWTDLVLFALLAVIVRLTFFFDYGWAFGGSILAPFLIVGLPKTMSFTWGQEPPKNFLTTFLLLGGISTRKVKIMLKVNFFCRHVLKLFSLYVFSFVVCHCVLVSYVRS